MARDKLVICIPNHGNTMKGFHPSNNVLSTVRSSARESLGGGGGREEQWIKKPLVLKTELSRGGDVCGAGDKERELVGGDAGARCKGVIQVVFHVL